MKELKILTVAMAAAIASAAALTGCQTRITATKNAEQVLPVQKVVSVGGVEQVITAGYQIASGGWEATARSPLYAAEALDGLEIGVRTNGTVELSLGKYRRDVSTNAVVMVDKMFSGGVQLVAAIGDAYVKIAGGGAQAATVTDVASKVYNAFKSAGGDEAKATVTTDATKKTLTVSDGSTAVTCDANGVCSPCENCTP